MELNPNQKTAVRRAANALRMPANTVATVVGEFYDQLKGIRTEDKTPDTAPKSTKSTADITCSTCGRTFKTGGGLASHQRAKHE